MLSQLIYLNKKKKSYEYDMFFNSKKRKICQKFVHYVLRHFFSIKILNVVIVVININY